MATVEKAFLVGTHPNSFRVGEPAEITGIFWVKPDKSLGIRLCYKARFRDGHEDYVPVSDCEHFSIVGELEANNTFAELDAVSEDTDDAEMRGLSLELEAEIDAVMAEETQWQGADGDFDPVQEAERNAALAHS